MSPEQVLTYLEALFDRQGARDYLGESVTMAEHMLQSAVAAEQAGAPAHLVAAALLHDVGHFVNDLPLEQHDEVDRQHEESGASFLATCFPPEVTEPVRLHVAAKRYLCTVEPSYRDTLSPASVHTLALQGGLLTLEEVAELEASPWLAGAVTVRRADDAGKINGLDTPRFADYLPLLRRTLRAETRDERTA